MHDLPLAEWRDFYVMIGTASGVIVGSAFIVATLTASMKEREIGIRGFITPIVVHLGSVLVGCAILAVPSLTAPALAAMLGAGGIAGVTYGIIIAFRIRALPAALDLSDRAFYVALPILAYALLAAAALMACFPAMPVLETLAVALVVLLVIGMRNAWDMATFMITRQTPPDTK